MIQQEMGDELQKDENQCLKAVFGAHKATPEQTHQAEVEIPPSPLYMDGRHARF
jgi:hypothetical protein